MPRRLALARPRNIALVAVLRVAPPLKPISRIIIAAKVRAVNRRHRTDRLLVDSSFVRVQLRHIVVEDRRRRGSIVELVLIIIRRDLEGLGDVRDTVENVVLGLVNVDFRRVTPDSRVRARMVGVGTRARGQPLAREEREGRAADTARLHELGVSLRIGLVRVRAHIAGVVRVRPESFRGRTKASTAQVPHRPRRWPVARSRPIARQADRHLNDARGEAKFVPGCQHTTFEVQIINWGLRHGDNQLPTTRRHRRWVIPL